MMPQEVIYDAVYYGATDHGHFDLTISTTLANGATHFDIVVWHQNNPTANLQATSVFNWRYQIPAGVNKFVVSFNLLPLMLDDYYWPAQDHYYLDMGFVDLTNSKVIYAETDGLTNFTHPPHVPLPSAADLAAFDYLSGLEPMPGQETSVLTIYDGGIERHVPPGQIFTRIRLPKFENGVPQ